MLGGVSWGEVSDVLLHVDAVLTIFFFGYISFSMLAVLNIITGVFVDNAVVCAKSQRDYLITRQRELQDKYMKELGELFVTMDADQSGSVTWDELETALKDDQISGYFATLGLARENMRTVFDIVDSDDSGEVEVDEFLTGCMKVKGEAKAIDVYAVMRVCNKLEKQVCNKLEKSFTKVMKLVNDLQKNTASIALLPQLSAGSAATMDLLEKHMLDKESVTFPI